MRILFPQQDTYTAALQCYVIRTLTVLLLTRKRCVFCEVLRRSSDL